jgi:hypothetical protein
MSRAPGELIAAPTPIGALILLAVNDHLLKAAWPGPLTGKVSDVAGLILLPFYLAALAEVGAGVAGRGWRTSDRSFATIAATVGLGFACVKLLEPANLLYERFLGLGLWVIHVPIDIAVGSSLGSPQSVVLVADPSDLLTLPALGFALWSRSWIRWPAWGWAIAAALRAVGQFGGSLPSPSRGTLLDAVLLGRDSAPGRVEGCDPQFRPTLAEGRRHATQDALGVLLDFGLHVEPNLGTTEDGPRSELHAREVIRELLIDGPR